jgi:signal transduction histidine kinase/HAMP domain-containing protein
MKLQTKLLGGFAVVTVITLVASGIGYWQTRKLSAALYEVGVVRLPGTRALQNIFEAKTTLDASKRELMREPTLALIQTGRTAPPDSRPVSLPEENAGRPPANAMLQDWASILTEELRRQERAWERADQNWRTYEALPKTAQEDAAWRDFATAWDAWRKSYGKVMQSLVQVRDTGDAAALAAARTENQHHLFDHARESRMRLGSLLALNERLAMQVKQASIASRHDAEVMQRFMLLSAALSVLAALGCGVLLSRMICERLRPMTDAFARIASGDLAARVPASSNDEIGHMATLMNRMVDSLAESEAARQQAAHRLVETADRLELALRTSGLGLWRRNLRTDTSEWDARMFELFGLPPADHGPDRANILAMIDPDDREAARAYWSQPPVGGRIYHYRLRIIRADGRRRHMEIHGRVQEISGLPAEWSIGVVGDITEIVESAAESARLRERLAQAKNMESLGAQAASIVHDFNNLLTSIKGFIDLAAMSVEGKSEAAELLGQAQSGALRARELVQRLLRQARHAGDVPHASLDPIQLARDTLALASASFPRNITHQITADADLPPVLGDASSLQRVLLNLCTNAAHAIGAKPGHIRLSLSVAELDADLPGHPGCRASRYVRISVSDNGCGMDAATLRRIFDAYFTTKPSGQGTGLGLAIVSDIIAEHDGGLTVESQPGSGTTFRIYLPAHPSARP